MLKPIFKITPGILNNLSDIAEIKAIVERSKVLPQRELALRKSAIVRMAHTSTSIEGNPLAEFEVAKVLAGKRINAKKRSIDEVKNYEKAVKKVFFLAQQKNPITVKEILQLHKLVIQELVAGEKAGRFRTTPVYIVNVYPDKEELAFTPPAAKKVDVLIRQLLAWIKHADLTRLHPILTAGILHYWFVTIHPFTDGNGRVGRLLTQLFLYRHDYDFRKLLVLEDYYNHDRQAYYTALQTRETFDQRLKADITKWLEYFTNGFLTEAQKLKDQILSLGFARKKDQQEQIFLSQDNSRILDFAATTGKITSPDVVTILSIPKRTAQDKLQKLVQKQLLKKQGRGPATFYILSD